MNVHRGWRFAVAALPAMGLAVALSGCGKAEEPWEQVYPATGSLSFKGRPIAGAQITLVPEDADVPESVRPRAVTMQDGTFQLGTYSSQDGAPAGAYKVLVVWHPLDKSRGEPVRGPNRLPAKYVNADTTDLVLEVPDSESILPEIELR
jgi:hypothetical protein